MKIPALLCLMLLSTNSSTAQGNFWQATAPLGGDWIFSLAVDSSDVLYAGTDTCGIWRSTDRGLSWNGTSDSTGTVLFICYPPFGPAYIGGGYGVFMSTNNGMVWSWTGFAFAYDIAVDSTGITLLATPNGIYRSTNIGSWSNSGLFLFDGARSVSFGVNGYAYAGAGTGDLFRSTDHGESWIGMSFTSGWIADFLLLPNGDVLLGAVEGLFRTTDNGDSWVDVGLTNIQVLCLTINSLGHIFAGTGNDGVFRSTDDGSTWEQLNTGLSDLSIFALVVDRQGYLYVGCGDGVFRSTQTTTDINTDGEGFPNRISLSQNYPNPFNSSTTITFTLPSGMVSSISIHNILGSEVYRIELGYLDPGRHVISVAPVGLSSGVYYYCLTAENNLLRRSMIVLK